MLTIWINYLDVRLQLYRDLELMPLDARGVWIDQIRECDCKMNGCFPVRPTPAGLKTGRTASRTAEICRFP